MTIQLSVPKLFTVPNFINIVALFIFDNRNNGMTIKMTDLKMTKFQDDHSTNELGKIEASVIQTARVSQLIFLFKDLRYCISFIISDWLKVPSRVL